jgi:hypothetical protein
MSRVKHRICGWYCAPVDSQGVRLSSPLRIIDYELPLPDTMCGVPDLKHKLHRQLSDPSIYSRAGDDAECG